jgi:hypothetical protein
VQPRIGPDPVRFVGQIGAATQCDEPVLGLVDRVQDIGQRHLAGSDGSELRTRRLGCRRTHGFHRAGDPSGLVAVNLCGAE